MIWNYDDAVKYIEAIPHYADKTGVERSGALLNEMGNPEKKLKIIHVAGTNGKGSVCSYINSVLTRKGYRTGMFTSPHLIDIRERIQIAGKIIGEEEFLQGFQKVYDAQERLTLKGESTLAYFDILFGIALDMFVKADVDYMIMETGLGGRLDSTNAVEKPVLSVITSISLEHTQVLGDTIEKIAAEKAGIIKKDVPVVYLAQNPSVSKIIKEKSLEMGALAFEVDDSQWEIMKNDGKYIDFLLHNMYYKSNMFLIHSGAPYQVMNCVLAITALKVMQGMGILDIDEESIYEGLSAAYWQGRMDEILEDIYIDGAHNPDGIKRFIEAAGAVKRDRKCILLFSVVGDKDYDAMIQELCESGIFERYVITGISGARRLSEETIRDLFVKYTKKPIDVFENAEEALKAAIELKGNDILMCAGSLYLVGEIEAYVKLKRDC